MRRFDLRPQLKKAAATADRCQRGAANRPKPLSQFPRYLCIRARPGGPDNSGEEEELSELLGVHSTNARPNKVRGASERGFMNLQTTGNTPVLFINQKARPTCIQQFQAGIVGSEATSPIYARAKYIGKA
jgi:hypothetical protein